MCQLSNATTESAYVDFSDKIQVVRIPDSMAGAPSNR